MSWLLAAVKLLVVVQATEPAVVGTILDGALSEPLRGAVVSLPDLDRIAVSDRRGRYAFPMLPPGRQRITVRCLGYEPRTLSALVPATGELEIDIALEPAPFHLPALEVLSSVAVLGVDPADSTPFPDRGISLAAVRDHPLLAEPDFFLALEGGEIALSPESPSGMHVRGGASDQTAYLLDGVPVLSPYHAAGIFSAWNPDALERLSLSGSSPVTATYPDALSGAVAGVTRTPGARVRAQGGVSTTQARATVDGPVGFGGVGYLVSVRSGLPDIVAPRDDPSYLRGRTGDLLATLEAPAFGGRVRLLGYDSRNRIDAAASPGGADLMRGEPARNGFDWHSRSLGAEWNRGIGGLALRLQAWHASGYAGATWHADGGPALFMTSDDQDVGVLATIQRSVTDASTVAGVRLQRRRTSYVVGPIGDAPTFALDARTPEASAFIRREQAVGRQLSADVALSATAASGRIRVGPRAELRWRPSTGLTLTGSFVRAHQFAQSLRNPESVVGNIFPPDVYVGAGAPGVPVAQSDQGVLAAEYHPRTGVRLGGQVYLRHLAGLVLVAPRTGEPFATGGSAVGSGTAGGLSLDAAVSGSRYGLVGSYGWQRVRLQHGDANYIPAYGTAHLIGAGLIVFPSSGFSVRLGATAAVGRRTTAVEGAFEWEGCNLSDRGCELGGSPSYRTDQLGRTRLPPYFRLDFGLRKRWNLRLDGKPVQLAVFGTVTNLTGRKNLLTVAPDPATGQSAGIEMRPRAPLVFGLDWRF